MINPKTRLILFGLFFLAVGLYDISIRWARRTDKQINSTELKPNDKERIVFNQARHTVTVVTRNARGGLDTRTSYLPSHSSVTVGKSGEVSIQSRTFGPEVSPFIGAAYSDSLRVIVGANLFYVTRFDLGAGISTNLSQIKDVRLLLLATYNVYSNTALGIGIDNRKQVTGLITLKF